MEFTAMDRLNQKQENDTHLLRMLDLTDYIEADFGRERADRFQNDIKNEMTKLGYMGSMFPKT